MRRSLAITFGLAVLTVGAVTGSAATSPGSARVGSSTAAPEAESAPGDDYLSQRLLTGNRTPAANAFALAGQEARQINAQTLLSDPADASVQWQFKGPTNVGGRITDLAVDPQHAGTVYVATAGGGVWKTTDAGATFTQAWPLSNAQAIGAIAVDPNGVIYAGTGETNPGGGSITFGGDGIYKSTDGGVTWLRTGLEKSSTIGRIVIDPSNPQVVYAAVSGNLFIPGDEPAQQRGVYKSTDAGATWNRVLGVPNTTTGAADIAISTQHPGVLYAAMWDHIRVPDHRTYTGIGSGVWKTSNGGASWTELTSPAGAAVSGLLADNPGNGRIGVAVDPRDDNNVYVNYANDPNGAFEAWFKSTNGGTSFTPPVQANSDLRVPVTNSSYVYGWWFAKVFVDPKDSNHIFVTGLCLWSSTDAGNSFANDDCGPHSDQHAVVWDPNVTNQVYLGDDGGFYKSTTNGVPGSWHHAAYEPWSQFDGLDVSEQDPSRIAGGLQDNGSQRSWKNTNNPPPGTDTWNSIYGGDGQRNLINTQNQQIMYACLQYGNCGRSTNGGQSMSEFDQTGGGGTPPRPPVSTRHNYFTPMELDPAQPNVVYYAGEIVNVSTDNGMTWNPVSNDLGQFNPGTETDPLYAGHYGTVTTMAIAPHSTVLWAGTDNGFVYVNHTNGVPTDASAAGWTQVSGLPSRWVSHIQLDPTNANVVYVAFSGFRSGDRAPYLERSTNGGATWTDLSAGLPEATVNDVKIVAGRIYAATDVGVFVSDANNIAWHAFGNASLPFISVTALRYIALNNTLYASTFGRGVWAADLSTPAEAVPEAGAPMLIPLAGMLAAGTVALAYRRRRRSWPLSLS